MQKKRGEERILMSLPLPLCHSASNNNAPITKQINMELKRVVVTGA